MAKTLLGGLLGGFAMYFVGFVFWGTPLSALAFKSIDDSQAAAVQAALAQNLTLSGTGTYLIPSPGTGQGTVLFGKGPIATVHFNTAGFPVMDSASLLVGLGMALLTGLAVAVAMGVIAGRVTDFASRAKVAILFALAATFYLDLGQPVFNHYGWGYFIYLFLGDFIGLAVAGLVVCRWFLPRGAAQ
jgi:hypothetical protein